MIDASLAFRLYGTTQVEPSPRLLRAGKLSAHLAGGALRSVRHDDVEILRAISFLVRDRDWGTYDPAITNMEVNENTQGFTITYLARCIGPDNTVLDVAATITGRDDGTLTFKAEAHSTTGFETNRCGFCILHPIVGVAGTPVTIEYIDGTIEDTELPDLIDPWQPFKDMRAITHTALPGVRVTCRMDGDIFEMEDQRNWSDASYKTYVRPLALPWPYRIPAGEPVVQQIVLTVADGREPSSKQLLALPQEDGIVQLFPGELEGVMPAIGFIITPEEAKASLSRLSGADAPCVQELLLHYDPTAGHGPEAFRDFAALAGRHAGKTTLEIAVPCQRSLDDEMADFAAGMSAAGFTPDAIMICPAVDRQSTPPGSDWPDCPLLEDVYAAAKRAFHGTRLGGGMLSYFTELNRKRVPAERLDFISHCTNPIVHAADDLSVMQTLEALPFITRSVRALYGDKAYRIGPSTIAMRQNPYGSRTMDNLAGRRIAMANTDPRHNGQFGAAYAMGYAIRTIDSGLEALILSALTGPFGLVAGAGEPVAAGSARPIAGVVGLLSGLAGALWRECRSSAPDRVLALAIQMDATQFFLVVNLAAAEQAIDLQALSLSKTAHLSILDDISMGKGWSAQSAWHGDPLTLRPFALARIDP